MDCPRPPPSLSGKRILVLEDEAFLVWELVEALEAAGALPMASSHSVQHGLEAIQSAEPFDAARGSQRWCRRISMGCFHQLPG